MFVILEAPAPEIVLPPSEQLTKPPKTADGAENLTVVEVPALALHIKLYLRPVVGVGNVYTIDCEAVEASTVIVVFDLFPSHDLWGY